MTAPATILLATRPLVPPWDEASKNFAYSLAKNIQDSNLEFHLLTNNEPLEDLGKNCIQHPIFRSGHFDLTAKARLSSFLATKGRSFDIVHFLFTPTPLNAFLSKNLVGKHPKTIQTIATLREEQWGAIEWKKMFFANRLVVYTEYSKTKLEKSGFSNVEKIYPGIDLEIYQPKPKDSALLSELNLSPNDFVVSYPGEYTRLGATDMLVDMIEKYLLRDVSKNIKLLFACRIKNEADRKKKEEIEEKIKKTDARDSVRFTARTMYDMSKIYNLSDIVVFPVANMEGKFDIPLVILEAYACGKPVILSDIPLFKEFSNSDISATIPRNDGEALWNTINNLWHDETKRKSLGIQARLFIEKFFDIRETSKEYLGLYQRNSLLGKNL